MKLKVGVKINYCYNSDENVYAWRPLFDALRKIKIGCNYKLSESKTEK